MNPGTKVVTRSGRTGTIQPKPFAMALYELVKLDDGATSWIRTDLLTPLKSKGYKRQKKRVC